MVGHSDPCYSHKNAVLSFSLWHEIFVKSLSLVIASVTLRFH